MSCKLFISMNPHFSGDGRLDVAKEWVEDSARDSTSKLAINYIGAILKSFVPYFLNHINMKVHEFLELQ